MREWETTNTRESRVLDNAIMFESGLFPGMDVLDRIDWGSGSSKRDENQR